MTSIVEITTTLETRSQAETLAERLVECHLAACVQIDGPILSIYGWKGAIQRAEEFRCTIKTTEDQRPQVIKCIEEHHPYDLPEILEHFSNASQDYSDWVAEQLQDESREP